MKHMSRRSKFTLLSVAIGFGIAGMVYAEGDATDDPTLSAGDFTLKRADAEAFAEPAPVLTYKQQQTFMRGRQHFNQKWVIFPSMGGDWGLGPTFIADKCSACHIGGGRGMMPTAEQEPVGVLIRMSVPGKDEHGGVKPHPAYGDQFQNQGLTGKDEYNHGKGDRVPPEGTVYIDWQDVTIAEFADGEKVTLRKPKPRFDKLTFGPIGDETMLSLRFTQPIFGMGLLEAVPEETLLDIAKKQTEHGISGRMNTVWDPYLKQKRSGRFGWKANVPSIRMQIALAFHGDIGATTSVFIEDNCTTVQELCLASTPNNRPEVIDVNWDETEFWTQGLAVPARRNVTDPDFKRGEVLFEQAKCSVCHTPTMKTTVEFKSLPQLANQTFHAYTDLLIHDMGEGLSDGRPDYDASPTEWRTPPLWGLGLSKIVTGSTSMLHDGRAANATEAILWHGGEAQTARDAFLKMAKPDREALLKFLDSI
jgi:CxxC motif-containing protein (DUF1111 family)